MYSIVPLGTRYNTELSLVLCYSAQVCKLFSDTRESNNFQVRNTCHVIVWLLLRPNDKFEFKRRKKEKETLQFRRRRTKCFSVFSANNIWSFSKCSLLTKNLWSPEVTVMIQFSALALISAPSNLYLYVSTLLQKHSPYDKRPYSVLMIATLEYIPYHYYLYICYSHSFWYFSFLNKHQSVYSTFCCFSKNEISALSLISGLFRISVLIRRYQRPK